MFLLQSPVKHSVHSTGCSLTCGGIRAVISACIFMGTFVTEIPDTITRLDHRRCLRDRTWVRAKG